MNDKKSCGNCAIGRADLLGCKIKSKCHNFDTWKRPTYLWLSILPTEPGWYWFRENNKSKPTIAYVEKSSSGLMIVGWEVLQQIGQWQGPITPEG